MGFGTGFTGLRLAPHVLDDSTSYVVETEHTGKTHIFPNLTADLTVTLPAAFDGAYYKFQSSHSTADAQDWIFNTASSSELFAGGVTHLDTDAGSAGDEIVAIYADQSNDDTLTINTPGAGSYVEFISDGTFWYVTGVINSSSAPAFS